ncbi:hypothetical protein MEQU1_003423 [Malassezia equina]|uniref:Uncharacterized protein n=1 Tax=Malassezia equina TaxID=1381935 RepID=A0AAF0EFJ6_9BASI|nr:hypothetical protein MEQU1_003423 [Malassezia equina]
MVQRREWRTPQWDLNEGIAIALSSLNGGEFTTLPVTESAPGRHASKTLNGGEFTTLPVTKTAPGRSSSAKKSKPTSTSVPYAGGANSQRQSSSASVPYAGGANSHRSSSSTSAPYAGGANSQRSSSSTSTASPTSTPKNSRPKASPTSSSKKSHASQGAASSSSNHNGSSSTDTSSSSSQSDATSTDSSTTSTPAAGAAGASTSASTSTPGGDGAASTNTPGGDGAAGMSTSDPASSTMTPTSDGASATPASTSLPSSTTGSSSSDAHASVDPSQNLSDGKDKKSSDHTGLIAGVCTAGGVVLLSLLLFLLYKLYAWHRNASKRKDDTVWPDVSHEATFDPAPLPTHHTNGAGFAMGEESREGLVSTHEQDPFQDTMPPAVDSPFADAMSRPGESDNYATVPDALVPAPAAHHHAAYLQPEAPRTNAQPAPEYQHYVVGQTYPQVIDMEGMYAPAPATRELYHGDKPVSMRT